MRASYPAVKSIRDGKQCQGRKAFPFRSKYLLQHTRWREKEKRRLSLHLSSLCLKEHKDGALDQSFPMCHQLTAGESVHDGSDGEARKRLFKVHSTPNNGRPNCEKEFWSCNKSRFVALKGKLAIFLISLGHLSASRNTSSEVTFARSLGLF